ncbi:hypothetical protein Pelo_18068 [Pelomyxa schiedti]|nr:hypothetical protein Pelo_18068 [Pelomyxa schiedti]
MMEWARSPALVRQWAEDWVLPPLWDAVFTLPLEGTTWENRGNCHAVHVSVSLTLGVVNISWFRCAGTPFDWLCGCLGENSVLIHLVNDFRVGYIIKDTTAWACYKLPEPSLAAWKQIRETQCNRKWIVGCDDSKEAPSLFIHKVVGGAPVGSDVVVKSRVFRFQRVEFSPLGDNTLTVYGSIDGGTMEAVVFVDLEATFNNKELVVKSKIKCEHTSIPMEVTWMPDGSPCILRGELVQDESLFFMIQTTLVDASSGAKMWVFPQRKAVTTLSKNHFHHFLFRALGHALILSTSHHEVILCDSYSPVSPTPEIEFSLHAVDFTLVDSTLVCATRTGTIAMPFM